MLGGMSPRKPVAAQCAGGCGRLCTAIAVSKTVCTVLDMAFRKDESCIHTGYTERNMSIPRCLTPACCAARPPQREASRPSASRPAGTTVFLQGPFKLRM